MITEQLDIIESTADDIVSMRVRGAGKIARAAAGALGEVARACPSGDIEELPGHLRDAALILLSTRPTAVSLKNAMVLTLSGMATSMDPQELRADVMKRARLFIARSNDAVGKIGNYGAELIPDNATILTHCNSSAALSAILEGFRLGKVERVINTETRPWRQGHITSRWLALNSIPVTMIVDSAVNSVMERVDVVLVGADTIAGNGDLINKIGTSQIALSAERWHVPFHTCAETYKFSTTSAEGKDVMIEDRGPEEVADPKRLQDLPGIEFLNPVFDVTPGAGISSIVTERGPVSPGDVKGLIDEIFPWDLVRYFQWL